MKNRIRLSILAILASLLMPSVSYAQLSTASLAPEEDSLAFQEMRARMDKIRRVEHRPTVALVLSGGGAKGAAHVGTLRLLEDLDIPVDMVLGTSMGGLVGGLYALGYDSKYLDSLLTSVDWNVILSDRVPQNYISYATKKYREKYALAIPFHYSQDVFNAMVGIDPDSLKTRRRKTAAELDMPINTLSRSLPAGYINGLNVNKIFSSMSAGYQDSISFRDLPIPFCCVASDMVTCKAKNWTSGSITEALRSTMSIPGLFDPVRTHGMVLVDGGTRNNFPTDIAREMGADYVIGVELSDAELEFDEINNIADILFNFIDMLGREAFSKNVGQTDVFIKPDLKGYNMLSFDSASVKDIIDRGYQAALAKKDELQQIKDMMPDSSMELNNKPADDINRDRVQISSIEMEGVKDYESRFLTRKLGFAAGDRVNIKDIEKAVSIIFATGSFESVNFRMLGSEQPYRLVFDCVKKPVHQFGVGARADSETYVDAIVNVGLNANKISGSKLRLTAKLGQNLYAEAHYSCDMPKTPTFNLSAKVAKTTAGMTHQDLLYRVNFWEHKEEAYFSNMHWTRFDFNAGLRNQYFDMMDWLSNGVAAMDDNTLDGIGGDFVSAFLTGRAYTFDDGYYPTRGVNMGFEYNWLFSKMGVSDFAPEHILSVDFRKVFGMGKHAAFILGLNARGIYGAEDSGMTNYPLMNFVGGYMPGRYLDQQIPFVGFGGIMSTGDYLAVADAALRFRFGRKLFTSFQAGYMRHSDTIKGFIGEENQNILGAGIELGYRTLVGPFKVNVHWNDLSEKVGVYASFGYDF